MRSLTALKSRSKLLLVLENLISEIHFYDAIAFVSNFDI